MSNTPAVRQTPTYPQRPRELQKNRGGDPPLLRPLGDRLEPAEPCETSLIGKIESEALPCIGCAASDPPGRGVQGTLPKADVPGDADSTGALIRNGNPTNPTTLALLEPTSSADQVSRKVSTMDLKESLVPTNIGKIKHLMMTYGPSISRDEAYLSALKTLVEAMPQTRFTLLLGGNGSPGSYEYFQENMARVLKFISDGDPSKDLSRIRIVPAVNHYLSQWAQDATLVKGNRLLGRDRTAPDEDDAVPRLAASAIEGFAANVSPGIEIDGGNQLATPDLLLVGSDGIENLSRNLRRYPNICQKISARDPGTSVTENPDELAGRLIQSEFPSQRLIVIGSPDVRGRMRQPAFHIDMGITLLKKDPETGKPIAAVGDPSLAKQAISAQKARDPEGYAAVVKDLNRRLFNETGDPLEELQNAVTGEDQARFDSTAEQLQKEGFLVLRIPYLGTDAQAPRNMAVPWITYNNALVDGERIFVPAYQIPFLDRIARHVYEQQGYEVIPVEATQISVGHGALNCITKVLEREIEM